MSESNRARRNDRLSVRLPAVCSDASLIDTPAGRLRVPGFDIPAREVCVDAARVAELLDAARDAALRAHAPYSNFHVGAAVVMADDPQRLLRTGANIENASFGAGVCAERTAVLRAAADGFRQLELIALSCVDAGDSPLAARSPCGICRQVIREFVSGVDAHNALILVDTGEPGILCDVLDIDRLLPWGFALQPGATNA